MAMMLSTDLRFVDSCEQRQEHDSFPTIGLSKPCTLQFNSEMQRYLGVVSEVFPSMVRWRQNWQERGILADPVKERAR